MSEFNDSCSIKLFGKMIPLLTLNQDDNFQRNPLSSSNSLNSVDSSNHGVVQQAQSTPMEDQEKHEEEEEEDDDNGRSPLSEREPSSLESSKNEEKTEQKNLKKPSKILQCPRCNSKETKFCYYNNYNVNQPRHFCKNCQRYWTAGGAMRNVPVGAGRRKTKSSSSALHYPHVLMTSDNNNNILAFGSDSSVFNLSRFSPSPAPPHPTALYCPGFPASFYSSPVPGKHSRDENEKGIKPSDSKALRIDDTDIAAKSSMMAALMMKTKNTMINSGGIFNGFQSKTGFDDDRNYRMRTFSVLQANPVAMSRSLNFHENT